MLSEVSHVGSVMWSKLVKHHFPQFHASWCYSYDSGAAHAASAANPGSWINGPGEPVMGSNYLCVDSLLFAWWHSVFSKTQVEHLQQENLSTSFYWELLNRCGMCCCRATGKEYIYIYKKKYDLVISVGCWWCYWWSRGTWGHKTWHGGMTFLAQRHHHDLIPWPENILSGYRFLEGHHVLTCIIYIYIFIVHLFI